MTVKPIVEESENPFVSLLSSIISSLPSEPQPKPEPKPLLNEVKPPISFHMSFRHKPMHELFDLPVPKPESRPPVFMTLIHKRRHQLPEPQPLSEPLFTPFGQSMPPFDPFSEVLSKLGEAFDPKTESESKKSSNDQKRSTNFNFNINLTINNNGLMPNEEKPERKDSFPSSGLLSDLLPLILK